MTGIPLAIAFLARMDADDWADASTDLTLAVAFTCMAFGLLAALFASV